MRRLDSIIGSSFFTPANSMRPLTFPTSFLCITAKSKSWCSSSSSAATAQSSAEISGRNIIVIKYVQCDQMSMWSNLQLPNVQWDQMPNVIKCPVTWKSRRIIIAINSDSNRVWQACDKVHLLLIKCVLHRWPYIGIGQAYEMLFRHNRHGKGSKKRGQIGILDRCNSTSSNHCDIADSGLRSYKLAHWFRKIEIFKQKWIWMWRFWISTLYKFLRWPSHSFIYTRTRCCCSNIGS